MRVSCFSAKNVAWMKNNLKMCCRVSKPLCLSRQIFADLGITVFATVLPLLILYYVGRPVQQGFFCDDDELKYPYVGETVSGLAVIAATLSAPLVVVILAEVSRRISGVYSPESDGRQRCSLGCAVRAYGVYFHGYLIMNILIQLLKLTTGKLRPVFMDVCRPDLVESNCTGYIREYRCTNEEASPSLLLEARQSFPSGHAALSFYCSVFLALYLEERLTVMCSRLLKITLQAAMLMASVWCSATRVSDHMHHEQDVVVGVLMGVLLALAMFYKVFRPCLWLKDEAPGTCAARDTNVNHADVDLEVGEPETPTPLLSKNGILISSNTGMHIGPFRLQGDKTQGGECI